MKFTYHWLKDFVKIKISPQELAEKLTLAGLEIVSLEKKDDDWVFEAEITSNRSDWLSLKGIAREVAAVTKQRFKEQKLKFSQKSTEKLKIKIENPADCPFYSAQILRDVKIAPSPEWLCSRLIKAGLRLVNNVVDITNYVLWETGQPLHAFDLDKLVLGNERGIFVRRAKKGEILQAIDGRVYNLDEDILVIADSQRPVAIAGVIGAKDAEVSYQTKNIVLEAAKFNPLLIRRMRQKLGINTESSYRFERDVDIYQVLPAAGHSRMLIQKIAQGKLRGSFAQPRKIAPRKRSVFLKTQDVEKVLGKKLSTSDIKKILQDLGFKLRPAPLGLCVSIPSFRKDINQAIDLIEEVCRIYGFWRIPTTLPRILPQEKFFSDFDLHLLIKELLVAQGFYEVVTLSLINADWLKQLALQQTGIPLANPLSKELELLRPTLIPSLLNCLSYNLNRKAELVPIFEIAKQFSWPHKEEPFLGILVCGKKTWCAREGKQEETMTIFHLKGTLEVLLERLGIEDALFAPEQNNSFQIKVKDKTIGYLALAQEKMLDVFDIKTRNPVSFAQINLRQLKEFVNLSRHFQALPIYPAVLRDLSIILKNEISVSLVISALSRQAGPYLKEVHLSDVYCGSHIAQGYRGLTFSLTYQSQERTLSDEEVNLLHQQLAQVLVKEFGAQLR